MSKSGIKNLIFDVGGVIILRKNIDFPKFDNYFSLEIGTIKKIVDICFRKKLTDKDFDEKSFFDSNFSSLLSWLDYQRILEEIYKSESVNKKLLSWIEKKRSHYNLFLLTNNTSSIKKVLKDRFKIDQIFNFVFNSAEIGFKKPDKRLFDYVLSQTNSSPNECLFIDDNLENIEAAKKIGFSTILFKDNENFFKEIKNLGI